MTMQRAAQPLLVATLVALGVLLPLSCFPVTSGAPCSTDANCPAGQRCVISASGGSCELGNAGGGGATGGGGGTGGGTAGGGTAMGGGVGGGGTGGSGGGGAAGNESSFGGDACGNGLDDDNDGDPDCADPDCDSQRCKAAAGLCDVSERCAAGACPSDGFLDAGTSCRATVSACDLEEACSGGPQCPADLSNCPANQYCSTTGCTAQRALAAACTADVQCLSGNCIDGFCCDTRCDTACAACNLGASTGTCSAIDGGDPGLPSCAPFLCTGTSSSCPIRCTTSAQCVASTYCSTSGICVPRLDGGVDCTTAAECASGNCADGKCCDSPCSDGCDVCNAPDAGGLCTPVSAGAPGVPACAPFVCGGSAACPTTCSSDSHCVSGDYCNSSRTCVPQQANGIACTATNQCLSGNCVEGTCCNSACANGCDTCSTGSCRLAAAASVGNPSCAPFLCNGASAACPTACAGDPDCASPLICAADGGCIARLANGQACSSANQCTSNNCVDGFCCNSACNGACDVCSNTPGSCTPTVAGVAGSPSCAGYVCNGSSTTCPTTCGPTGCASGYNCTGNLCVSNGGNGAACTLSAQCTSGNCVDGVCCNSTCTGPCDACNNTGSVGTCASVSPGNMGDPACTPYVCGGAASCPTSCSTDANCSTGRYCQGTSCVPKLANGVGCSATNQCTSGNCVDGVCCNSTCTGACNACNLAGAMGTCSASAGAGNPSCSPYLCDGASSGCPLSCASAANCASTHYCGATSACEPRLANGVACTAATQCLSNNCVDGVCCDSACGGACDACNLGANPGLCQPRGAGTPGAPACSPYVCNGAGTSCPNACATDANCASTHYCSGTGACIPKLARGVVCSGGNQCGSGSCVDGVCCESACNSTCAACNLAGSMGSCTPHAGGTDPENGCGAYTCDGAGACRTGCTGQPACSNYCKVATSWCNSGACVSKKATGTCAAGCECGSGSCADGYCCDTACPGVCEACNQMGAEGTCRSHTAGTDPESGCGNFTCNNAGACNTTCAPSGSCPTACKGSAYCTAASVCGPDLNPGQACTANCQCANGGCNAFYLDQDNDNFGAGVAQMFCGTTAPAGLSANNGDCNDASALINPGASETVGDEIDFDCNGQEVCFLDADNDGYRLTTTIISIANLSCGDPQEARASEPTGDCCDTDANARPNQTSYFTTARTGGCPGAGFDYNCDSVQTQGFTQVSSGGSACSGSGGFSCVALSGIGWIGAVPACGQPTAPSNNYRDCNITATQCLTALYSITQSCR